MKFCQTIYNYFFVICPATEQMACCRDFYFYQSGNIILTVVPRPTLLSMMAEPP